MEANYQLSAIHRAVRVCPSCKGTGKVQTYQCAVCEGAGSFEVGCVQRDASKDFGEWLKEARPNVEVDGNHYGMTNCIDCGHFVPSDEVTLK